MSPESSPQPGVGTSVDGGGRSDILDSVARESDTIVAGTVAANLGMMVGVWHDVLQGFHPDGTPMTEDVVGAVPGPYPYDNLVYIDFDGTWLTQTNVTFAGRPYHHRTFRAEVVDGVLRFAQLGPDDPGHIGVAAGPGNLVFLPSRLDAAGLLTYSDPDYVRIDGDTRTRVTTLYKDNRVVRTMLATGTRLTTDTSQRVEQDPRGADGPVHETLSATNAFVTGQDS